MPLPRPNKGEKQDDFIDRCMANPTVKDEFPDNDQRLAVCFSQWKKGKRDGEETVQPDRENQEMSNQTSRPERLALLQKQAEVRLVKRQDADDEAANMLTGYAAVFYDGTSATEFELYDDMVERIMPGAFDAVLAAGEDVRGLFNHDPDHMLGRTAAGTMVLRTDNKGLMYAIELGDTSIAKDVAEHVKRGDVDGSSFAFRVRGQRFETKDGIDIREITEVGPLFDVGPVTFPAYKATEAGYRDEKEIVAEVRASLDGRGTGAPLSIDTAKANAPPQEEDAESLRLKAWVEGLEDESPTI